MLTDSLACRIYVGLFFGAMLVEMFFSSFTVVYKRDSN